MVWWIPLRMHDLYRLRSDDAFINKVANILHRPLLIPLVGCLHLTSQISISSLPNKQALTSLTGAKKFSLIPGVGI